MSPSIDIAVCYFGITRGLEFTLPSLQRNVVGAARSLGETRVFAHFFAQTHIDNPRSGEKTVLDPAAYKKLDLDKVELEAPNVCLETRNFALIKAHGDPWDDRFRSLSNLIHQLHSLEQVCKMALNSNTRVVAFCRPDLRYHDNLRRPIARALSTNSSKIWLPAWQSHSGRNDRFAICSGDEAIRSYGMRAQRMLEFCEESDNALHAERLVAYCLQRDRIAVEEISHRASRIRADGSVATPDRFPSLPKRLAKRGAERLGVTSVLRRLVNKDVE